MKNTKQEKTTYRAADFFERCGKGEHLNHPSFAMDDCDFEGMIDWCHQMLHVRLTAGVRKRIGRIWGMMIKNESRKKTGGGKRNE